MAAAATRRCKTSDQRQGLMSRRAADVEALEPRIARPRTMTHRELKATGLLERALADTRLAVEELHFFNAAHAPRRVPHLVQQP